MLSSNHNQVVTLINSTVPLNPTTLPGMRTPGMRTFAAYFYPAMASPDIRFFSPQDNQPSAARSKPAGTAAPGGYISPAGKLVFPARTMQRLGIEAAQIHFRVGVRAGKRRIDQLYLLAATDATADAFALQPGAKGRFMNLATQLRGIGLDYARVKYRFSVELIEVGQQPALALTLTASSPKQAASPRPPYMGKPRGRKTKALI